MSDHEEEDAYQLLQQLIPLLVDGEARQRRDQTSTEEIILERAGDTVEVPRKLPKFVSVETPDDSSEETEFQEDPLKVAETGVSESTPDNTPHSDQEKLYMNDITDVTLPSASQEKDILNDQTTENEIDNSETSVETSNGRETPNTLDNQHVISMVSSPRDKELTSHLRVKNRKVIDEITYPSRISISPVAQEASAPSTSGASKGSILARLGPRSNRSSSSKVRSRRCAICRSRAHPTVDHGDPEKLREYHRKKRERLREISPTVDRYYVPSRHNTSELDSLLSDNHRSPPRARNGTFDLRRKIEQSRSTRAPSATRRGVSPMSPSERSVTFQVKIPRYSQPMEVSTVEQFTSSASNSRAGTIPTEYCRRPKTPQSTSPLRSSSRHIRANSIEAEEINENLPDRQEETFGDDYSSSEQIRTTHSSVDALNIHRPSFDSVWGTREMHKSMDNLLSMPPTSQTPFVQPQVTNTSTIAQLNPLLESIRATGFQFMPAPTTSASSYQQSSEYPVATFSPVVPQKQLPILSQQQSSHLQFYQPQQIQLPPVQQLQQSRSFLIPQIQEPSPAPVPQWVRSFTAMRIGDIPDISKIPVEMLGWLCSDPYCPWKNPEIKDRCRDPKCRLGPKI